MIIFHDLLIFIKNPDTGSNQRGCISTLEEENYCLRNPTLCSLCDGNEKPGCNSYEFPQNRRKCIQCDNKVTDDCPHTLYTETIEKYSKYCTQPTDDCMSICNGNVDNWNEACASDISENDNNYCRGNSACSRCKENNCNLISISECIPETPATTIPTSPPSPIVKIIVVASITIIVFIVLICFLRKKKWTHFRIVENFYLTSIIQLQTENLYSILCSILFI